MQKMKLTKLVVRTWIGATTMIGFVGGWAMLAHSGKPVSVANAQTAQTSASITVAAASAGAASAGAASAGAASAGAASAGAASAGAPAAVPTLAPIPSLDQLAGGAQLQPVQSLPALPRITGNLPRIRTGGS